MRKRIIIIILIAIAVILFIHTIEVQANKRAFESFKGDVQTSVVSTAECMRRTIASEKAEETIAKEISLDLLRDKAISKAIRKEEKRKAEEEARRLAEEEARRKREANRQPNYPGGGHLTPSNGVYYFGNQRETYYNLDMSWVVSFAHQNGIGGEYWIRSDGCKMLGDYIILACNRSIHPYGSIVLTSLGYGISLDTGGFAYDYPYGVDIAVNW